MRSKRWSARNIDNRVKDILEAIGRIADFITGLNETSFCGDRKTQSAVERELLTISEACIKISELEVANDIPRAKRLAARFPEIPWTQIRGIGNILRHDYGHVDARTIWSTITGSDLNDLKNALERAYPRT